MKPGPDHADAWTRPPLTRNGPIRTAGGFYRTAEVPGKDDVGGIPLVGVDDAIVGAVRLAYKVAEAQIDRSARLADRLRSAGERAVGPDAERHALDAAESLVLRSMLSGLSWLEGIAAEEGSPIKRMLAVEYRMLGTLLGLRPQDRASPRRAPRADAEPATSPLRETAARAAALGARIKVVHAEGKPRAVRIRAADIDSAVNVDARITFYRADRAGATFEADLIVREGVAVLRVKIPADAEPGPWRAAVCDKTGLQVGVLDIEL